MKVTISGIVSLARGSTSGRPSPSSSVSWTNHPVASSASSRLPLPSFAASSYTLSSTSVMLWTSVTS